MESKTPCARMLVRQRLNIPAVHLQLSKKRVMPFLKAKQQYAESSGCARQTPRIFMFHMRPSIGLEFDDWVLKTWCK